LDSSRFFMTKPNFLDRNLTAAFLAGPWELEGLVRRGAEALGRRHRWLRPLARRVLAAFADQPAERPEALLAFLLGDRHYTKSREQIDGRPRGYRLFWLEPRMGPAPWPVPALATTTALAEWLGLTPGELAWFADCHGRAALAPEGPLRHYTYRWLEGKGGKRRLLEQPKARLKVLQRKVLRQILDLIPPHESAHGYRRGRSIVSYAAAHANRDIVIRLDLRDFFPSIRAARVHALFRTAGYPLEVARALTGLCTNVAPADVWPLGGDPDNSRNLYRKAHLPQGAPTSPALANLCAYSLDRRLAGLARALGATYTRYADDLAFSGPEELERRTRRFQVQVCRIALEEGFEVHTRKTRFMRRGVCQQLAGVVVNDRVNCRREVYDRLKALLFNCVRFGPAGQNRAGVADFRAHLLGRVAHIASLHPARGRKLRGLFDRIDWSP
jgi:hypothetical protein